MALRPGAAGNVRPQPLLCLVTSLLGACSINPKFELATTVFGEHPRQLQAVPFFPQTENQCGPAALATILGAAGVDISPEALSPQVYLPGRQGSLQLELVAATRRAGLVPYVIADEPQALLAQIDAGRPVLVLQNLRTRSFPAWHYAVMVGFDPVSNRVFLNSGTQRDLDMAAPRFLRTWGWAGRWAMVALRPGELPAEADPHRYAETVAAFELVAGGDAAIPAWRAAMKAWPQDASPWLALGNLAYARGELIDSLRYFRGGLELQPEDPALNNNLASVLGELGCPREGEERLRPLVESLSEESTWKNALLTTLQELAVATGNDPEFCFSHPYSAGLPPPDQR